MNIRPHAFVLAIYPSTRGLAFVLFESALSPVDWGVKIVRGARKNDECLRFVGALLDRYEPRIVVLQDTGPQGTARAHRIRHLNAAIAGLIGSAGVEAISFSRAEVMRAFASVGVVNKRQLAEAIAKHIPAFQRYLPPVRKPWMSEDSRMNLFDAASLVLTFFRSPSGAGRRIILGRSLVSRLPRTRERRNGPTLPLCEGGADGYKSSFDA
jgi:hypothetical protein